jgi:tetratricopeptide (TPR) repeat protein
MVAFGVGGLTGKGAANGLQGRAYLPEAHTDFVFSVIGEEYGLVATTIVALAYFGIFWCAYRAMRHSTDLYRFNVCLGGTLFLVFQALINMGVAQKRLGRNEEAIEACQAALGIDADLPEAHNNLGNLFLRRNDLTNAAARFSEAIRLNPKHSSAHNNLGIVLARQNRVPEAIPEFEAAVRLKPDYLEAWINLGNAATSHGRFQQAVTAYEMALRIRPGMPQAVEALKRARARIASTGG